jgi:transcription elongation factor GreA
MPTRDSLPPVLRGDDAADLTPDSRRRLEALAHEAQEENALAQVRDECAARLRQPHPSPAVEYLLAAACALLGEVERAHQTLLALGDKLAEEEQWEPLAAVADRALDLESTRAAARLLVRAHEGLRKDPERIDALSRAWAVMPDDLELGLLFTVRLGEAGHHDQRRDLLVELMPQFAVQSRWAGLEEAALEFAERAHVDGLLALARVLPQVAAAGALAEARQLAAIVCPPLAAAGRAGACEAPLREVVKAAVELEGAAAAEPFRATLVEAIRHGSAAVLPDAAGVLKQSGIEDARQPLADAIVRFDTIAALAPGRPVYHSTFGAGRVAVNDGEHVLIDFAHSKGHRMPYAAALRSLTPIGEDDLRLVRAVTPAELVRLRNDEPGELVVRALKAVGGEGDAQKLKVFLVGSEIVPAKEWTAFWRKARGAAEKDPRIDHARAFEQHYRLAPEGAAGADRTPLPALELRKPVKSNLVTLRKFLQQHPGLDQAAAQRFGRYIAKAMVDPDVDRTERARAGLLFARWYPGRRDEWASVLSELWEQGLAVVDLPNEDEQLALLAASHAGGVEADAILSALDSRFATVREAAARLRDDLDDHGRAELRRTLLQHAPRYPTAALRLIDTLLDERADVDTIWKAFHAALTVLEDKPKPSVAEKVLRWLEPESDFDARLDGEPCAENVRLRIRVLLRQWRSSDRFLFPALEAAERLGLAEEAQVVREARQKSTDRLFEGVGQQAEATDLPVMTRATWERLKIELERLEHELRTVIPQTIRKARELGDLRENAEYHSAKLKQANVSRLVAALQLRITRARFVENADYKDGVVGLGSEVVLEAQDDVVTYWILGEGEHHHGDHVISFQTAVGRVLMGHAIGDEVELGEGAERRRWRVVSIERRLPPVEETSGSTEA